MSIKNTHSEKTNIIWVKYCCIRENKRTIHNIERAFNNQQENNE